MGQFYLKKNFGDDASTIYRGLEGEEFFYIADYARREDAEYFLVGVRSGSRSTQYNCLRALAVATPERLKELGIAALIAQNRKFRSVLFPLIPKLLSLQEVLALRSAFEESSPHGVIGFFRVLERKSFWTFVDEGLAVILSDPEPVLQRTIEHAILSKVAIYESLSSQLRGSISSKISKLRDDDHKRNERIINLLEFTIKTA